MTITLEAYNPEKHHRDTIAELIYDSDEEMHSIVYGAKEEGVRIISELMAMEDNYYSPQNIKCGVCRDEIICVIVGFPVEEKTKLDNSTGKIFAKVMGMWALLKRMPVFFRMARIMPGEMDKDGYYILGLSVIPAYQGQGFGSRMIEFLAEKHHKLYLHVNINKPRAQKFYKKVGFYPRVKGTMAYKGREIGTYLMEKTVLS